MLKRLLLLATAFAFVPVSVHANIVSLTDLTQITAPPFVDGAFLEKLGLPAHSIFAERQGVVLPTAITTDTSIIPAGTIVDSYFVAFNQFNVGPAPTDASATFDTPVLGVIFADLVSGFPGPAFAQTNFLGAIGTDYSGSLCFQCGYEFLPGTPGYTADQAFMAANLASFHVTFSEPGDFARVLVQGAQPVPGPIVGAGIPGLVMAFLGWLGWRRMSKKS